MSAGIWYVLAAGAAGATLLDAPLPSSPSSSSPRLDLRFLTGSSAGSAYVSMRVQTSRRAV